MEKLDPKEQDDSMLSVRRYGIGGREESEGWKGLGHSHCQLARGLGEGGGKEGEACPMKV